AARPRAAGRRVDERYGGQPSVVTVVLGDRRRGRGAGRQRRGRATYRGERRAGDRPGADRRAGRPDPGHLAAAGPRRTVSVSGHAGEPTGPAATPAAAGDLHQGGEATRPLRAAAWWLSAVALAVTARRASNPCPHWCVLVRTG